MKFPAVFIEAPGFSTRCKWEVDLNLPNSVATSCLISVSERYVDRDGNDIDGEKDALLLDIKAAIWLRDTLTAAIAQAQELEWQAQVKEENEAANSPEPPPEALYTAYSLPIKTYLAARSIGLVANATTRSDPDVAKRTLSQWDQILLGKRMHYRLELWEGTEITSDRAVDTIITELDRMEAK